MDKYMVQLVCKSQFSNHGTRNILKFKGTDKELKQIKSVHT